MSRSWLPLKAGDIVDVIAPASGINDEKCVHQIESFIKDMELIPRFNSNLFLNLNDDLCYLSNTDEVRFEQLHSALYSEASRAVWCLRGGYGCMKLLPKLYNLDPPKHSKVVIGFSDITALHLFLNQKWGWKTIHGEMLNRLGANDCIASMNLLTEIILGKRSSIEYPSLQKLNKVDTREAIQATVIAGNLSLFQSSIGTPWEVKFNDKIVIIEEVREKAYRIDRILEQLLQTNLFMKAKAVIFSDMTVGVEAKEAQLIYRVIKNFADKLNFLPVFKMSGVGHGDKNLPIPFGGRAIIHDLNLNCLFEA